MVRTILTCVLSAALGIPVLAQNYEDLSKKCYESGNPDQAIEACSAVIKAGLVDRNDLIVSFMQPGHDMAS